MAVKVGAKATDTTGGLIARSDWADCEQEALALEQ